MAEPARAMVGPDPSTSRDARITDKRASDEQIVDLFKRVTARLTNRSKRVVICRNIRRGLLKIPLPASWAEDNPSIREWVSTALPERQLLDLNLTNVLGERRPELSRVPLGTTDTAIEDGDQLEVYAQSAFDAAADLDAVVALLVQDAELAAIVTPSRAGPEEPPQYLKEDAKAAKGTLRVLKPDPQYDRDKDDRPPDKSGYTGRDEKKSKKAYEEARLRWLAEHPLWDVELVNATDYAPLYVRGKQSRRWVPKGLVVRTLFDKEELLYQGFSWKSMGEDVLIPLDFDAGRTYGNGGQIYLYRAYLMVSDPKRPGKEKPIIVYSVGGDETWETGKDGNTKAAVIDCEDEFGLTERFWDVFEGLHFEDDPDYRGIPFIWPLVQTMLNHESTRAAVRAAMWDVSFTGHTEEVNPNLPKETILEGFKTMATTKRPLPGKTIKTMGKVQPYIQTQVGQDAYRVLEMDRRDLDMNTPDSATTGGGEAAARSGHALVVGEKLLRSGKRQIGRGVLDFCEFVTEQILRIACAAMEGKGSAPPVEAPVFVTEEEQLDDGDVREKTSVMLLNPRWVGGQYRLQAEFQAEGNAVEIEQAASLAERGFATDEDVDKARGVKNTTLAQVKRAIYRWRMSPEGQMEINMRAAQYQGNAAREKLLRLVAQAKTTPSGGPVAAIDPSMPGTAALGMGGGGQQQGPPPGSGFGGGPTTAQQQRAGVLGGQMGSAAQANDARAVAEMGA